MSLSCFRTILTPQLASLAMVCLGVLNPAMAQDRSSSLPDWLSLSFEQQSRIQVLDGQFRAGLDGDDQGFEWRNTLQASANFDGFSVNTEFADMRTYLVDDDSPLDSFTNNPFDFLQANVSFPVSGVFSAEDEGFIKLGRFTMDQGSRRFVARNRYRNTINAFTGVQARLENGNSYIDMFYTHPTIRRVDGPRIDNDPHPDDESSDKIFWGAFLGTGLTQQDMLELYVLGLDENRKQPANQRFDVIGTGARLYRSPAAGRWNYETEAMFQSGDAPALDATSPLRDHSARYLHLTLGYTFESAWQPRLSFIYHYASGEKNPLDNESNALDHFYGVPRPDFGPTGLYRAFQRENINSPGLMLNLQPASHIDAYLRLQRYSLAAEATGWRTTRYRHPGGLGEDQLGTQLEGRLRWRFMDNKLTIDGGFAFLFAGAYMDQVNKGDSRYFYLQTIVRL